MSASVDGLLLRSGRQAIDQMLTDGRQRPLAFIALGPADLAFGGREVKAMSLVIRVLWYNHQSSEGRLTESECVSLPPRLGVERKYLIVRKVSVAGVDSPPRRSLADFCARGYAAGLLTAIFATGFEMMRRGVGLREVSLVDYVMNWPAVFLAMACVLWRGAEHVPDNSSEQKHERRPRARGRFVEACVAIGLVYGLIATLLELWWRGWRILPGAVVLNLLLFPFVGLVVGLKLGRAPGEPRWSWRCMRFSMRTMLLLIAYLSLLFGLGVVASRIGLPAQRYFQRHVTARDMASALSSQLPKSQAEVVVRFRNASGLREGTIPVDIMQSQKDFLKSLSADEKVDPQYRKHRYELIADGEEYLGHQAEKAVQFLTANIDYFSKLAAKYEKAQREPWLPVEPDAPRP